MDFLLTIPASAVVFLFGSAIGSFLNVVIYRLPAQLSLLYPPSRCPKCSHPLQARDNIPVLGWLLLRGKCRYCRTPISPRYPLVETVTGILFLAIFWQFNVTWQTIGYWAFCSWLLALALIDLDTLTLPNPLTQTGLVLGILFAAFTGGATGLFNSILGAVLGLWLFDTITTVGSLVMGQTAMGAGDAKLAAMIGAWLGWKLLLLSGFLACTLGALVGGGAIALRLISRRQPIPFGPFLALGATLSLFWGQILLTYYLRLFSSPDLIG